MYCIFPYISHWYNRLYVNTYWSLERGHEHFGPARAIAHPEHGIRGARAGDFFIDIQSDASRWHQTISNTSDELGISCIPVLNLVNTFFFKCFFGCPRCPRPLVHLVHWVHWSMLSGDGSWTHPSRDWHRGSEHRGLCRLGQHALLLRNFGRKFFSGNV